MEATAGVDIAAKPIRVHFQKRAHNPLLLAAGFENPDVPVPWVANKRLTFTLG